MSTALILCGLFFGTGLVLMGTFNILAALISAVSLIIYAFLYTPLKRVSLDRCHHWCYSRGITYVDWSSGG